MSKRLFWLMSLLAVLAIIVAGCGSDSAPAEQEAAAEEPAAEEAGVGAAESPRQGEGQPEARPLGLSSEERGEESVYCLFLHSRSVVHNCKTPSSSFNPNPSTSLSGLKGVQHQIAQDLLDP